VEKEPRNASDGKPRESAGFSIHRSESNRTDGKSTAIVIQIRMKQPGAQRPKAVLYQKDGEFWFSSEK
jgi:hypothetical protein